MAKDLFCRADRSALVIDISIRERIVPIRRVLRSVSAEIGRWWAASGVRLLAEHARSDHSRSLPASVGPRRRQPVRRGVGAWQSGPCPSSRRPCGCQKALSGCWVFSVVSRVRAEGWSLWRLGSGGCGQANDLVPGGESGGHLPSVLDCGESVASGSEVG
jgi:hypothetical protein